jgi:hypothetical protein
MMKIVSRGRRTAERAGGVTMISAYVSSPSFSVSTVASGFAPRSGCQESSKSCSALSVDESAVTR